MKSTDRESVRVRTIAKGYALYRVVNSRGCRFSTIDDEIVNREFLSSDQGEEELEKVFLQELQNGFLPRY